MKLKPLIVSVAILAVLAVAAYFLSRPPAAASADARIGQPLVDRAIIEKASQLRVADSGATVLLVKHDDGSWRDSSYFDLPADFDKLSRFVSDLANAKVDRFVTANPERLSHLEFGAKKIALLDKTGGELWSATLGKTADSGGTFICFGNEQKAYLTGLNTWIDHEPKNWADSTLLNLKPTDIAKAEIGFSAGPAVVASRAKPGDPFSATAAPAGQKLATDKIDSLLGQITNLHFSDTSDPSDPNATAAKQHARTVKLTTFDGKTYTLAVGRKPEEKITKPAEKKAGGEAGKASAPPAVQTVPAGPVYAFVTCSDAAASVNALAQKRACQINEYTYTNLPEKASDLFAAVPAPPAPMAAPAARTVAPIAPTAPKP